MNADNDHTETVECGPLTKKQEKEKKQQEDLMIAIRVIGGRKY